MRWLSLMLVCMLVVSQGNAAAQVVEWKHPLDAIPSAPTLFPNETHPTGVAITAGPAILLLHGDGSTAWTSTQSAPTATPATVADIDGDGAAEVLAALADGVVVCLDSAGRTRWTHALNTSAGGFKVLVAADLTPNAGLEILAGFDDGWLNCLGADGTLLWRFWGDKFRVGGIAVGCVDHDNAPEIVYGTDNGHIYCLDTFGRVQWRYCELAPYGRSGPNLADLNNNGKPEVFITRSNVGNATCLMALNGADGTFLWRTQDAMQGYVSNAIVDLDGDGKLEVLHGDKGNNLYCENADGSRRWKTELGGRGLFWAPCVADVDGDGQLEIIAGMRATDPKTGACLFVVGANGAVKASPKLGTGANAAPAVGDIDGDGQLEVIVATEGPSQIQCLTWNATGRVAWPSLRGDSAMTAHGNVPMGDLSIPGAASAPHALADLTSIGDMTIEGGEAAWGDNAWKISWQDPVPENAFLEVSVIAPGGLNETRIVDLRAGATTGLAPVRIEQASETTVSIHLHTTSSAIPALSAVRIVKPLPADFCHEDTLTQVCNAAFAAAEGAHADASLVRQRLMAVHAEQEAVRDAVEGKKSGSLIADQATQLRGHAAHVDAFARMLEQFWKNGGAGDFVCWQDPNPWDAFDPEETPGTLDMNEAIRISAYGQEYEDIALSLLNITAKPIDVRCVFAEPSLTAPRPAPEPKLAGCVTLRRSIAVPTRVGGAVNDALPELDASRSITLPPGEARQLWLVVNTHGLEPGTHELKLFLGGLTDPPTIRTVPIRIEVWPIQLPGDVYAKMNWASFNPQDTSGQAVRDMLDHGVSVIYGPPPPPIPVDAEGNGNGEIKWTEFDAALGRVPKHFTLLWPSPPSCKWPNGTAPGEDTDAYFNGFKTGVAELAKHLTAKGFPYRQWALYPIDEPWNTGFTEVPHLKKFCERVKKSDPQAQVYADPAGLVRAEYLDEFKGLIDIWQPEMNLLKRDPKLLEWFHANAKRLWAYEAPGPAKNLLPLGHYRGFAWLAWKFGLEGAGYWVYRSEDTWWPVADTDYSAVYQTRDQVIPSRRWEADRDGVEDYRALYVLRQEIEQARSGGRAADADRAQALMDDAVQAVVGWQVGSIDEITRMTRDYEIDFTKLMEFRTRIAEEIIRLRGMRP